MLVTTLIANHNYAEYLADAIQSAHNQTYEKQCICVIDDKSNDNSIETAKAVLFKKEPKVELFKDIKVSTDLDNNRKYVLIELPQTVGPSEARNVGIQATMGETDVYAILDADDEMYETKISELVKFFNWPEIGIVYADYDIFNVVTNVVRREFKEPFNLFRLYQECIIHSGSLIRKEALVQIRNNNGFYNRTMRTCEDYELWVRICKRYLAYHVPKILTKVRWQPKNSTDTVAKQIWEQNWTKVREAIQN